jgi:hypothetical protein
MQQQLIIKGYNVTVTIDSKLPKTETELAAIAALMCKAYLTPTQTIKQIASVARAIQQNKTVDIVVIKV